ncbi:hypothetical protein OFB92_35845, partial [Escherichia coli]|nr:hypothetical protein [Escherichia coli]
MAVKPGMVYFVDLQSFEGGRQAAVSVLADYFANPHLEKSSHDYKRTYAVLKKDRIGIEAFSDDPM